MTSPGARVALVLALGSCAAANSKTPDVPDGSRTQITLTASAPEADAAAPATTSPPAALRLTIGSVDNPAKQGVAVSVTLRFTGPDGGTERAIGTVVLYPSDQPGTFTLPLSAEVRDLLARKDGARRLHVALQSAVAQRPLVEPLKLVVTELGWR